MTQQSAGRDPVDGTVFQWLIERGQPEGQVPPVWWTHYPREGWTPDATQAAMFADREETEAFIDKRTIDGRAVEHGFWPPDVLAVGRRDPVDVGPATEAGRALNDRYPVRLHDGAVDYDPPFLDAILAIEQEAAATERRRVVERIARVIDVERLGQAWWNLVVAPSRDDARRWEPDRYNAGYFLKEVMAEYARLGVAPEQVGEVPHDG